MPLACTAPIWGGVLPGKEWTSGCMPCRAQYEVAQKAAMELAARIDKGGPDKPNEMQASGLLPLLAQCYGHQLPRPGEPSSPCAIVAATVFMHIVPLQGTV